MAFGVRRLLLVLLHSVRMRRRLALVSLASLAALSFCLIMHLEHRDLSHSDIDIDALIAELAKKERSQFPPPREPVDVQNILMHEDAAKGIVWGKMRGNKEFDSMLGLPKPTSKPVQSKKRSSALVSPNIRYYMDIHEPGYFGNDSIDSRGLEGGKAHCQLYDVYSPTYMQFECLNLTIKPQTPICLYDDSEDVHVSRHIREEGIWEPHMVMNFQNILYGNPDMGFIDIGANIGQYSLIAAAMGHTVVAVEPYKPSLQRFHRAIELGGFHDLITVVQNAISNERHSVELKELSDNQGGVSLTDEFADPWCEGEECPAHTRTILMDDLLEVINFERAIIKIDIEGHEHRAFVKSLKLLSDIKVPFIMMEWIKLRSYHGSEIDESLDKDLVFELVDFMHQLNYLPYSLVSGAKLKRNFWYAWPDDIMWKTAL